MGLDFSPELRRRLSDIRRRRSASPPSPGATIEGGPPFDDRAPASPGAGPHPPAFPVMVHSPVWVDAPTLLDPPEFQEVSTDCGLVHVRRLSVATPESLRAEWWDMATKPDAFAPRSERSPLFFDTESLGLGSQVIFLAGLAWMTGETVVLEQILARDYSREGALLRLLADRWRAADSVVTYNGRSYDIPLTRDRLTRHRLGPLPSRTDLDLLHRARRRWKEELPDCKLTTVEYYRLGRARQGDVPGSEIPPLYHRAVRTRDARLLAPIFHHNALDLLTLVELLPQLDPEPPPPDEDAATKKGKRRGKAGGTESAGTGRPEPDALT